MCLPFGAVDAGRVASAGGDADVVHPKDSPAASRRRASPTSSRTRSASSRPRSTDLRRRLERRARRTPAAVEQRLADTQRSLAAVTAQNERLAADAARGPRPDHDAQGGGRPARAAAGRLRHLPAAATRTTRSTSSPAAASCGSTSARPSTSTTLVRGQEVMLNEALNVVAALEFEEVGEVVMLKELLADGDRALVIANADEERVVRIAEPLRDQTLRAGDSLLLDSRAGYVYERVPEVRGRGAGPRGGPRHRLRRRSAASSARSSRSATPSSCPTSTPSCSRSTSSSRRRACCSTARPAAARR